MAQTNDDTAPLLINAERVGVAPSGRRGRADGGMLSLQNKSRLLRATLVLGTAGLAVLFRNNFSYFTSIIGSVGSSLLAFILPCMFQNQLYKVGTVGVWGWGLMITMLTGCEAALNTSGSSCLANLFPFLSFPFLSFPFLSFFFLGIQGRLSRAVVFKNYAIAIFGFLGGVAGLYVNIQSLIA
jgi:hypothetical protein